MRTNVTDISKYYLEDVLVKGKNFPHGTWNCDEKYENAKNVTKTLIEKVLKWSDDDIKEKLSANTFRKYSLTGMFIILFNASPYLAIDNAYPGKFKQWDLPSVSKKFWNMETAREATRWLIEEKLKWSDDDIKEKLSANIFEKNSLGGMLVILFNDNSYFAIENAYPGKFKPWELSGTPKYFWNLKTASDATRWLIEEKLKWSDDDIKHKLSKNTFRKNSLGGMLAVLFNDSPYRAIENAYPGKFKPWELPSVPKKIWNVETAREATIWLIEEKLKWSDDDIKEKLSANTFIKNSLTSIISLFNGSPYLAIENAYPGKFKPWEVARVSKKFWNMETAREATIWLIEEKLKWSDEDIKQNLSLKIFKENSLVGMLNVLFNGSPYLAIENAYSGKFKPWEFTQVPNHFWNLKTASEATTWLIEEKLKWSDEDVRKKISVSIFKKNLLGGMLTILFNNSPYLAIENAYPGKFKPWELPSVQKKIWNMETAKEATMWLIEEKLKWGDEDVRRNLSKNTFKENSLVGMLDVLFNGSPYFAIENAYPGKFKPWEFSKVPKNFWNMETAKEATMWLIEEKLKWSDEDVRRNLSQNTFKENSLTSIISLFNGSPYLAIENAYPGKFKPWEFKRIPNNFWNLKTAREATIWLIEEKLKWGNEDVEEKLTLNTFKENSLKSMLNYLFNIDPHQPIEMHLKINSKDLTLIFNNNNLIIK